MKSTTLKNYLIVLVLYFFSISIGFGEKTEKIEYVIYKLTKEYDRAFIEFIKRKPDLINKIIEHLTVQLKANLNNDKRNIIIAKINNVAKILQKESKTIIIKIIKNNNDSKVKIIFLDVLEILRNELSSKEIPMLIKLTKHKNANIRALAVALLSHTGPETIRVIQNLNDLLLDKNWTVVVNAIAAISSLKNKATSTIPRLIATFHSNVFQNYERLLIRKCIVSTVGQMRIKDKRVFNFLFGILNSKIHPDIRVLAIYALGKSILSKTDCSHLYRYNYEKDNIKITKAVKWAFQQGNCKDYKRK